MRKLAFAIGACVPLAALWSCAGSNGNGTGPPTVQQSNTQSTPSATVTQSIAAAAGGTVTLGANGSQLTVTIPPHALAADASVTVAAYSQNPPQPSSGGTTVQLPAGAQFFDGFTVSTGGIALLLPLQVSAPVATASSGTTSAYLAMYNASAARYSLVDTASISNGNASNNNAKNYVGISSAAGAATPYIFYGSSVPASTPAPISITVAPASPGPFIAGTAGVFTAKGSDANGNPYVFTPSFALSSSSLGSLQTVPGNPLNATVNFASFQQNGSIQVADPRTGLSGSLNVSVQSQRPASNGDTYAYSGTLTQEFDRLLPDPMPTATSTQTVTQTVSVKDGQSFQGQSNLYDFLSNETDAGPLQTVTSQSDTFVGYSTSGGQQTYVQYGSNWQDQNGDTLSYVYPAARILDELPESSGQTWQNSAAASIAENVTVSSLGAAFSSSRVYNGDGTYTENSTYPPGYFGIGSSSDHGTIVENADGSANYSVPIYGAGDVQFDAPANGSIAFRVYFVANPQPSDSPVVSGKIPQWYSTPTLYSESNVDKGQAPIPASCNASASFGTTAQQLVQTIDRLDTVLGYSENTTTTTYVAPGYGAVCIVMSDVTSSYYDFQGDSTSLFYSHPYQITKISETLGLQKNGTAVIGSQARSRAASVRTAYALIANSTFVRTLEKNRLDRVRALPKSLQRTISQHNRGVK